MPAQRPAVSCAAGGRGEQDSRRHTRPLPANARAAASSMWKERATDGGRRALAGESHPGQGRASGVSCTAGLGCTWERGAGRRAASDSRRGGLQRPTDCGVEREQPEPRCRGDTSLPRRPLALGLWVRMQPGVRNPFRGQNGRSLRPHLSGTRINTCQPNA
jgi:hypothetical protein